MAKRKKSAAGVTPQPVATEVDTELVQTIQFLFGWNAELVRFYTHRYQQYGMLPLRLLGCTNLSDTQALQSEFLEQLATDYRDEAAAFSKIAGASDGQSDASLDSGYAAGLQKAQKDAATIIEKAKAQAERIVASAEEKASRLTELPEEQIKKRA